MEEKMTSLNITLIILIIAAFVNVFLLFLIFKNTNKNAGIDA